MKCKHCRKTGPAVYWDPEAHAWHCLICGWLGDPAAAERDERADCNIQFSVNCGSIVSQETHGRTRVRTWIDVSRVTSLWHAHQEKIRREIVYFTHQDSFDYGYEKYRELKQEHYAANGWPQRLVRDVCVTDTSPGSAMIGGIVKTNQSSGSVGG